MSDGGLRPRLVAGSFIAAGIVLFGYALMKKTTPTAADVRGEIRGRGVDESQQRAHRRNAEILRQIRENAYSDRPVWDVHMDKAKIEAAEAGSNSGNEGGQR